MAAINPAHHSQDPEVSSPEKGVVKPVTEHEEDTLREFSPVETKRLLRKIDWSLLPLLSLLYLLSFLDRANIGNARLAGLEEDLNMTGKWDYSVRPSTEYPVVLTHSDPRMIAGRRLRLLPLLRLVRDPL